ncbi:UDP-N-acetylmuramoyl-tripeptide--D-alanyl-D-alanine ligase [Alteribacillus persepolensis]|uniref:UDP-N-acetylmuramoyl-tripeptide--D-alanyl-D-alanine ligase n=1 Tax=Alteribacillus persepolensis TaxID=568899 RepID=A0A1G8JIA6_9BACI|nr:UDP-N-acetylmuramoyl-tripeptide--D-alanyl-D-alanine ligase [Alteribacillus persepolensis]SDI30821.1 UDP-N-acetylmuramoyl-tripeptide--D-alanyl-D-alanine ligase [Alteribacillus persepolensis]
MIITLFVILYLAAWGYYTARLIKRSTHMLQLNAYRNERFWRWISANTDRTFLKRNYLLLIALVPFIFGSAFWALLLGVLLFGIQAYTMTEEQEKKKLVITARVKRLFVTITVLYVVITGVGLLLGTGEEATLLWVVLFTIVSTILSYLITMAANFINWPIENQINQYYFHDAEKVIKSMPNLEVVGITGSYGKTSTKHILETVLSSEFNVLMTPESYNTKMGVTRTVRSMLKPYHDIFIAEMGAKQENDIQEICELVHQKYGILTAIGEQHLETFKTLENIKQTKFELIETLPHEGTAFLNKDDQNIMSYPQRNKCRTIYYGIAASDLHYRAADIRYSSKGSHFTVYKYDGSAVDIETKLLGRHNIYNILAAIAMGAEKGISLEKIARAIKNVQPVEHRLELKKTTGNITIIDDSFNSNPVGSRMALEVLGQMPEQKILVTPGMIELGEKEYELNKALAEHAADVCDFVILVGKKQTKPLQDGLAAKGYPEDQFYVAAHLQDALDKMNEVAVKKSVVLLENDLPDTFNE